MPIALGERMTAGIREIRPRLIRAIVLIVAIGAVLAARPPATAQVIIDNGTIQLGINPQGHFNVIRQNADPQGNLLPPLSLESGATRVGLRFMSNNSEATAPATRSEGWGASGRINGVPFQGGASVNNLVVNLVVAETLLEGTGTTDSGSSGSKFTSVTTINWPDPLGPPAGSPALRVTHIYSPAPETPNLYQVDVTIENISGGIVTDVRYRRVMDWDIAPTTFNELVTIHVGDAANLFQATNDGFVSPQPLDPPIVTLPTILTPFILVRGDPDHVHKGPEDQGAMFDFTFGDLDSGVSKTFQVFYGAAATEDEAKAAMAAVKIEVYSLGQPNPTPQPLIPGTGLPVGEPNTFIFGFRNVGGAQAFPTNNHPPVAICQDIVVSTSPGTCSALIEAATASANNGSFDPDPNDSIIFALEPSGLFGAGTSSVTLTVTDTTHAAASCTATVTVVDTEPPTITCPASQVVECTGPNGAIASPIPSATDNCGVFSVRCAASGSTFPLGSTTVTCSATDTSGNTNSSCNATVTVVDSTPPTVSCLAVPVPRPREHDEDDRDKHSQRDHDKHRHDRDKHQHHDDKHDYSKHDNGKHDHGKHDHGKHNHGKHNHDRADHDGADHDGADHDGADHHRDDDKHHHQDCEERHRFRDDRHHSDRKHGGHCGATGLFKVTASDLCGNVTITLGSTELTLTNGEVVIGIRQSDRPGFVPVSSQDHDNRPQTSVKTFRGDPQPVIITATDAAGNVATATCPLPPKEREDDDHHSKKGKDRERDDRDSKKGRDRDHEHKDSRKGKN